MVWLEPIRVHNEDTKIKKLKHDVYQEQEKKKKKIKGKS